MTNDVKLPPLPAHAPLLAGYTAAQMQAYARAAIEQQAPAYPPDDGPLTDEQVQSIRRVVEQTKDADHWKALEAKGWQIQDCKVCGESAGAYVKPVEQKDAERGASELYPKKNPLGGPAKVFDAMAAAIRAGDRYRDVLRQYGFTEQAEQRQEAVGFTSKAEFDTYRDGVVKSFVVVRNDQPTALAWGKRVPVYTSPQSLPWVGLDEDELWKAIDGCANKYEASRAIESLLRSKNAGGVK